MIPALIPSAIPLHTSDLPGARQQVAMLFSSDSPY